MALFFLLRGCCVFDLPVALDRHRTAGEWLSGRHRGDGRTQRFLREALEVLDEE